jgi:hypothetical protein
MFLRYYMYFASPRSGLAKCMCSFGFWVFWLITR